MSKHHHLKIHPKHMSLRRVGLKPVEIRKNDRDFHIGDYVHLHEYAPGFGYLPDGGETEPTWAHESGEIVWMTDFGMAEGYVCFAMKPF